MMTYYEIKKIWLRKGSRIALGLMLAVLVLILYFIIGENGYVNEKGDEEIGFSAIAKVRALKKEWAGELTEAKIREVLEENVRISNTPEARSKDFQQNDMAYSQKQGFLDIRDLCVYAYGGFNNYDYYLPDSLSPDVAVDFYPNRIKNLKEWLNTEGKDQFSEKEKEYLISQYETLKTPLYYDYQAGWKSLFQYAPAVISIATLILSFLCAGIFSGEFQQKSSAVLYSSLYGRDKAVAAKIKAGIMVVTIFYWGVVLLYTGLVLGILGADGASCQIQASSEGLSDHELAGISADRAGRISGLSVYAAFDHVGFCEDGFCCCRGDRSLCTAVSALFPVGKQCRAAEQNPGDSPGSAAFHGAGGGVF